MKTVHTAPWPHCPNKNVISNRLNWPCDNPHSLNRTEQILFEIGRQTVTDLWSCGGKRTVSKTTVRLSLTDNECSSVGRTQLSDTGVGDELTVVGHVTRGIAGQGPVDKSCYLEHDALPHRSHRRDMVASPGARHEPSSVLN